jgi:hypothetical protein
LLTAISVTPLLVMLVIAAASVQENSGARRLPCPLYPNGVVAYAATVHEACALSPGDALLALEIQGRKAQVESATDVDRTLTNSLTAYLIVRESGAYAERRVAIETVAVSWEASYAQLAASAGLAALLIIFVLLTAVRADVSASLPFSPRVCLPAAT